ncbi:MAG: hypothetical protein ACOY3P_08175 [Planctomycetota bacterium]
MIVGHFPAVTAIEFFGDNAKPQEEGWTISFRRVARNPMALVEAVEGANVRAILSGHIHRLDQIEALGQTFICAGSVSGAKWLGHDHETPEGFGIFDCRPDGNFEYRYHDYGWNVEV